MIQFIGDFTEAMKMYAEEKLEKISTRLKFENGKVSYKKLASGDTRVEVSIDNKLRAAKNGDDYYNILIDVIDTLWNQIERKERVMKNIETISEDTVVDDIIIGREKTLIVSEMTLDEAVDAMEGLGHAFFVYKDVDRGLGLTVIYKRHDESYGLIHCK